MAIVSRPTLKGPVAPGFCFTTSWVEDLLDSYYNKESDDIRLPNWSNLLSYNTRDKVVDITTGRLYTAINNVPAGTPLSNTNFWITYEPIPFSIHVEVVANINNPATELNALNPTVVGNLIVVTEDNTEGAVWWLATSTQYPEVVGRVANNAAGGSWIAFPQSGNPYDFGSGGFSDIGFLGVANLANPSTELATIDSTAGKLQVVYQTGAVENGATLYVHQAGAPVKAAPYVCPGSVGKWVAIAGNYVQELNTETINATTINTTNLTVTNPIVAPNIAGTLIVGTFSTANPSDIRLNSDGNLFLVPDIYSGRDLVLPDAVNYADGTVIFVRLGTGMNGFKGFSGGAYAINIYNISSTWLAAPNPVGILNPSTGTQKLYKFVKYNTNQWLFVGGYSI